MRCVNKGFQPLVQSIGFHVTIVPKIKNGPAKRQTREKKEPPSCSAMVLDIQHSQHADVHHRPRDERWQNHIPILLDKIVKQNERLKQPASIESLKTYPDNRLGL